MHVHHTFLNFEHVFIHHKERFYYIRLRITHTHTKKKKPHDKEKHNNSYIDPPINDIHKPITCLLRSQVSFFSVSFSSRNLTSPSRTSFSLSLFKSSSAMSAGVTLLFFKNPSISSKRLWSLIPR